MTPGRDADGLYRLNRAFGLATCREPPPEQERACCGENPASRSAVGHHQAEALTDSLMGPDGRPT